LAEVLFYVSAFFAEVTGTVAGFGSSTILLPIALFFFDFRIALVLVAFFHLSGGIGRILFFRRSFDKRLLLIFGAPSVVLTVAGALLVNYVPQSWLKIVLAVFLIAYAFLSLWKQELSVPASSRNAAVGGGLSGFFAGLIGTGGVLRGAFLTAFGLEKAVYIATAAVVSVAVDVTRIPVYVASGFLEPQSYITVLILAVLAIPAAFVGNRIVKRVPQSTFRKIVLAAIILVSIKLVYDGFSQVFTG